MDIFKFYMEGLLKNFQDGIFRPHVAFVCIMLASSNPPLGRISLCKYYQY